MCYYCYQQHIGNDIPPEKVSKDVAVSGTVFLRYNEFVLDIDIEVESKNDELKSILLK